MVVTHHVIKSNTHLNILHIREIEHILPAERDVAGDSVGGADPGHLDVGVRVEELLNGLRHL